MSSDGLELEDKSIIANNVRLIREHWGDKNRKTFVELLGGIYPYDTIKSYEYGDRPIPDDYIEAISNLYGVTVQMIKEQTLTEELLTAYDSVFSMADFMVDHDLFLYTAAFNEAAMANEDFVAADSIYQKILEYDYTLENLTVARNLYYKSFIEAGLLPGAANTLMMLCFEYMHITTANTEEDLVKALKGLLTNGQFYAKYRNIWSNLTSERKQFIDETKEMFDKCISALAKTADGRIHAEYFMALKYFICMIDNGRDYRENLELGSVMLQELSQIDNRYASMFITHFLKDE